MPRERIRKDIVYTFAELSAMSKETAREHMREIVNMDCDWWDTTFEDAVECARILGIEIGKKPITLCGGGTRYDPAIYFGLAYTQGDGASYEGTYAYGKQSAHKIREHAPMDKELHRIAEGLLALQAKHAYQLEARIDGTRSYHRMDIEVYDARTGNETEDDEARDGIRGYLNAFAGWIYDQLRAESDYRLSDEHIDEILSINDYEFNENGRIV